MSISISILFISLVQIDTNTYGKKKKSEKKAVSLFLHSMFFIHYWLHIVLNKI